MSDKSHASSQTDISEDLLPFVVELWTEDGRDVESVLARVQSGSLSNAVFNASRTDFPDRRITLRRGQKVIADSMPTDRIARQS